MKFLSLVLSSLRRKKLRTILTMLSIGVAFVLFAILGAVKQALGGGIALAGKDRIVVRHKVSLIQSIPIAYEERIRRIPGVSEIVHVSWFNGIYQDPKNFFPSHPTDPEALLAIYPEITISADVKRAWLATRTGAIVGRASAARFGWKVGQRIPLTSPIWPRADGAAWEFDLVGIYDAKKGFDNSGFYFRYDYFDESRKWGQGMIGWYVVRVGDSNKTAEIAKAIDEEFANSAAETKAEPEGVFVQSFAQQIGDIGKILLGIMSAVFFTILLVAGNTMAQGVRERTAELGVLKALGFGDGLVLGVVLAESMSITIIGGMGGLLLGAALVAVLAPALSAMMPNFYLPTANFLVGSGLTLVLGFAAGILPAIQAGQLRIAEALRRGA